MTRVMGMPLLELDPDSVQAGVLPLLIVLGLGIVIALGFLNMRSHIRKIQAPYAADVEGAMPSPESAMVVDDSPDR